MNETEKSKQFNDDLDRFLRGEPVTIKEDFEMAQRLQNTDFSDESQIRRSLRARLAEMPAKKTPTIFAYTWQFASVLMLALLVAFAWFAIRDNSPNAAEGIVVTRHPQDNPIQVPRVEKTDDVVHTELLIQQDGMAQTMELWFIPDTYYSRVIFHNQAANTVHFWQTDGDSQWFSLDTSEPNGEVVVGKNELNQDDLPDSYFLPTFFNQKQPACTDFACVAEQFYRPLPRQSRTTIPREVFSTKHCMGQDFSIVEPAGETKIFNNRPVQQVRLTYGCYDPALYAKGVLPAPTELNSMPLTRMLLVDVATYEVLALTDYDAEEETVYTEFISQEVLARAEMPADFFSTLPEGYVEVPFTEQPVGDQPVSVSSFNVSAGDGENAPIDVELVLGYELVEAEAGRIFVFLADANTEMGFSSEPEAMSLVVENILISKDKQEVIVTFTIDDPQDLAERLNTDTVVPVVRLEFLEKHTDNYMLSTNAKFHHIPIDLK